MPHTPALAALTFADTGSGIPQNPTSHAKLLAVWFSFDGRLSPDGRPIHSHPGTLSTEPGRKKAREEEEEISRPIFDLGLPVSEAPASPISSPTHASSVARAGGPSEARILESPSLAEAAATTVKIKCKAPSNVPQSAPHPQTFHCPQLQAQKAMLSLAKCGCFTKGDNMVCRAT